MKLSDIKKRFFKKSDEPIYSDGFSVREDYADELPEEPKESEKTSVATEIIDWLEVTAIAVTVVIILFTVFFRVVTISGPSMQNTLHNNDKVVITNFAYTPKNGDIVVVSRNAENSVEGIKNSDEPIIKRVIATGGQTVDIDFKKGIVYVDGQPLHETYISTPTVDAADVKFPVYVPEGYIFVLGDNRGDSTDSRFSIIGENGLIDTRYVLGHAVFRFLPFDRIGGLD